VDRGGLRRGRRCDDSPAPRLTESSARLQTTFCPPTFDTWSPRTFARRPHIVSDLSSLTGTEPPVFVLRFIAFPTAASRVNNRFAEIARSDCDSLRRMSVVGSCWKMRSFGCKIGSESIYEKIHGMGVVAPRSFSYSVRPRGGRIPNSNPRQRCGSSSSPTRDDRCPLALNKVARCVIERALQNHGFPRPANRKPRRHGPCDSTADVATSLRCDSRGWCCRNIEIRFAERALAEANSETSTGQSIGVRPGQRRGVS